MDEVSRQLLCERLIIPSPVDTLESVSTDSGKRRSTTVAQTDFVDSDTSCDLFTGNQSHDSQQRFSAADQNQAGSDTAFPTAQQSNL